MLRIKLVVVLLMSGLLTLPSAVLAEDLIAAIVTGNLPQYQQAHQAFEEVLRKGGFDEAKLKVFKQTPNADKMSLTNSIRRSVMAGAKLLVAYGASAALVAKEEAKDVPVLFADIYDPVALGLVQTLASPGANRTGACTLTPFPPLLDALNQVAPGTKRVMALYSGNNPDSDNQVKALSQAVALGGGQVVAVDVSRSKSLEAALQPLAGKSGVLFVADCPQLLAQLDSVLRFAQANKLPVISQSAGTSDAGVLLSYASDPGEQGRLIGVHALQILAGQKAFILPVREGKKTALEVNLKTAAALGLTVPETLAQTAGRVVR